MDLVKTDDFFGLKPADRGLDKRHIDEFGAVWKAATKIQAIYRARVSRKIAAQRVITTTDDEPPSHRSSVSSAMKGALLWESLHTSNP